MLSGLLNSTAGAWAKSGLVATPTPIPIIAVASSSDSSTPSITPGGIAAAVIMTIFAVVLIAVALYFLCFRSAWPLSGSDSRKGSFAWRAGGAHTSASAGVPFSNPMMVATTNESNNAATV